MNKGELKKVVIVSDYPHISLDKFNQKNYDFVGVEKGGSFLIEKQFQNLLYFISDADSIIKKEKENIIQNFQDYYFCSKEKNSTDLELAVLWAIKNNYSKIIIFQKGKRQDHFFCNLLILRKYTLLYPKIKFILLDDNNDISFLMEGSYKIKQKSKRYISIFAIDDSIISSHFLKWNLNSTSLNGNTTCMISNEVMSKKNIFLLEIKKGGVFLFQSIDS